jgi:hypothetical protein
MSKFYPTAKTTTSLHRFDVSKLAGPSLDEDGKTTSRGQFQKLASNSAKEQWKVDGSIQDKWVVICSALMEAAKGLRSADVQGVEPILQKRNQLYLKWLGSGLSSNR